MHSKGDPAPAGTSSHQKFTSRFSGSSERT